MLGELQVKKWNHFFALFDVDHDGLLEQSDIETLVQRLTAGRDPALAESLRTKWMLVWAELQKVSDQNRDNVVSPAEWRALADQVLSDADAYQTIPHAIGELTFDAFDLDGDGQITVNEWRAFFIAHGIAGGWADMAFEKMDVNHDGFLSKAEAMQHLRDYFYSNDPQVAGNWFFGPL